MMSAEVESTKMPKGMTGRPLVDEEFERMFAAAPDLDFYLRGLVALWAPTGRVVGSAMG